MKRIPSLLVLFLALASSAAAQERTLLGRGFHSGGFGGPVVKFSEVDGDFAVFVGARGGWIINHTLVLGVGGYGLVNDIEIEPGLPEPWYIEFGYGGVELEYINSSNSLIHFTIYLLIGGGGLSTSLPGDEEAVFVMEPAANIELNVTSYFRLCVGGAYRYVTAIRMPIFDDEDLSGAVGVMTFKFGAF
jgi:hypothetical protein